MPFAAVRLNPATALTPADADAEVIVTCLKQRYSGVSGTISALLPIQAQDLLLGYVGADIPGARLAAGLWPQRFKVLTLWQAVQLSARRLPDGRPRLWHVRRNHEMLLGWLLRDVLRLPIRLVFTSAAIRRHSALPRWLIGRMDAVIATSARAASFVPRVRAVVAHGVDTQRFAPPPNRAAAWRALGLPGALGVGIVGRVRQEKGVHLFVRAMLALLPALPDVTAVIIGLCQREDAAFVAGLQREITQAGLSQRFVWAGEVAAAQMPAWYQALHVVVACPLYEGFGLTPIEAMACGCAVVASRTGAFESMVEPGVTGQLVPVGDAAALQAALRPLLAQPEQALTMGLHGRKRVQQHFSIEAETQSIAAVYRSLWAEASAHVKSTAP